MKTAFLFCFILATGLCNAQVKLGTNPGTINSSVLLEMESSTKGLLPPRMSYAQIQAIANPANGLLVYDTDIDAYRMYKRHRWVLLTEKDKSLGDPPGEFNTVLTASGGTSATGKAVAIAPDGSGFVVAGSFSTTLQVTDNFSLTGTFSGTSSLYNIFLIKYAMNGTLLWGKCLANTGSISVGALTIDNRGKIIVTGKFTGTCDFDPGPGVNSLAAGSQSLMFIAK